MVAWEFRCSRDQYPHGRPDRLGIHRELRHLPELARRGAGRHLRAVRRQDLHQRASLSYQFSAVVSGFTPLLATALYGRFGWIGPALLFSFYGLLGLIAAPVTRDTWGPAERDEVASWNARWQRERAEGKEIIPEHAPGRTGPA